MNIGLMECQGIYGNVWKVAVTFEVFVNNQWRIQDFPNGGALFCHKWGGAHPVFR